MGKKAKKLKRNIDHEDHYDVYIEALRKYVKDLKKLAEEDPEKAKKIARKNLIDIGVIDENGNPKPPYNGEKVHEEDFTMGPGEIKYDPET